jgi:Cap4 SAVED domain
VKSPSFSPSTSQTSGVKTAATFSLDAWFVESLQRLARGEPNDLVPYLVPFDVEIGSAGTRTTLRTHILARDGNERLRVKALTEYLAEQIVDYCMPRSRILEAQRAYDRNGSTGPLLALQREAKRLFTDIANTGESGELLVYVLLERLLAIPQLLCKMNLKTNARVHVHGADGAHVQVLDNGRLGLYWCESKLYKDFASAIRECFGSISPYLLDDGGGASTRDLMLLNSYLDTGSAELDEALVKLLTNDPTCANFVEVRGACLVGFDVDDYPTLGTTEGQKKLSADVRTWGAKIAAKVVKSGLAGFHLEVFCVPFEDVAAFRTALLEEIGK